MLMFLLTFVVTCLDQISKEIVVATLRLGEGRNVIPGFFDIRHVQNTGAAWGLFSGWTMGLAVFSSIMLAVLIRWRRSIIDGSSANEIALGVMMGGVVGNLIDRVRLGYVVDFLDFFFRGSHFPTFNMADVAICCGAALYVARSFVLDRRKAREAKARKPESNAEAAP